MHFGMGEWQVRILNPDLGGGFGTMYKVYLYRQVKNVYEFLQGDSTVIQVELNERYDHVKPIAELPAECLQRLMEGLWDQGIRPKARRYEEETSLLREVIETQKKHLGDMRAVAFGVAKNSHSGDKVLRFLHESDEVKR